MEIGDVLLPSDLRINEHPRVIISHPQADPERLVLVNFSSADELHQDASCVIEPGEHPWVIKPTYISWRDATLVREADLDRLVESGAIRMLAPASDALLTKILEGAERTDELPGKCHRVLVKQGLISG